MYCIFSVFLRGDHDTNPVLLQSSESLSGHSKCDHSLLMTSWWCLGKAKALTNTWIYNFTYSCALVCAVGRAYAPFKEPLGASMRLSWVWSIDLGHVLHVLPFSFLPASYLSTVQKIPSVQKRRKKQFTIKANILYLRIIYFFIW